MAGKPGAAANLETTGASLPWPRPACCSTSTFLPKEHGGEIATTIELIRSTEGEKQQQIDNVLAYAASRNRLASEGLKPLQQAARKRENCFAALIEAVKTHSLGQISHALYEVGGEYRRNM